jgi:hypothetical protein
LLDRDSTDATRVGTLLTGRFPAAQMGNRVRRGRAASVYRNAAPARSWNRFDRLTYVVSMSIDLWRDTSTIFSTELPASGGPTGGWVLPLVDGGRADQMSSDLEIPHMAVAAPVPGFVPRMPTWLLTALLLGLVSLAAVAERAWPDFECRDRGVRLLDGFGGAIEAGTGNAILIGRERRCELVASGVRVPLPWWWLGSSLLRDRLTCDCGLPKG